MSQSREDMLLRRQKILADFGDLALQSEDLDEVLNEACRLVSDAMATGRSKVLEIEEGGKALLVRAGVGWGPDVVGKVRIPLDERSSESFSIKERKPVISSDISEDDRFDLPQFMRDAGVRALANVPIFLPHDRAYGLLQVDASEPRDFSRDDTEFLRTYATILGPIIDRLFKLSELRKSEQRFRLTVEAVRDYAIFITDKDNRITDWLPGAEQVFGWSADEARGQSGSVLFTPEDRESGEDRKEIETARRDGVAPNVRWHLCKDGSRVFIEGSVRALRDAGGQVTGFIKIGQNVTQRREANDALRVSKERLRVLLEGIPQLVWRASSPGEWTWASPQWTEFTGQSEKDSQGWGWLEPLHPDDRDAAREAWIWAEDRGGFEAEYRICHAPEKRYRWFQTRATPVRDNSGKITEWLGTSTDIDDMRQMHERQAVLVAELQHRTRNLMSVVRSTADRTIRKSTDLSSFTPAFKHRMAALARVQGLLSRLNEWDRISFDELIRTEIEAFEGASERTTLHGPKGTLLRSSMVQTLAMALHELATNALKYGAFSQEAGRLAVTWRLVPSSDGHSPWLHIDWREENVAMPQDETPAQGGGLGRELIERALPHQLGAKTTYVMETDGVHCTISLPISERTNSMRAADA